MPPPPPPPCDRPRITLARTRAGDARARMLLAGSFVLSFSLSRILARYTYIYSACSVMTMRGCWPAFSGRDRARKNEER